MSSSPKIVPQDINHATAAKTSLPGVKLGISLGEHRSLPRSPASMQFELRHYIQQYNQAIAVGNKSLEDVNFEQRYLINEIKHMEREIKPVGVPYSWIFLMGASISALAVSLHGLYKTSSPGAPLTNSEIPVKNPFENELKLSPDSDFNVDISSSKSTIPPEKYNETSTAAKPEPLGLAIGAYPKMVIDQITSRILNRISRNTALSLAGCASIAMLFALGSLIRYRATLRIQEKLSDIKQFVNNGEPVPDDISKELLSWRWKWVNWK